MTKRTNVSTTSRHRYMILPRALENISEAQQQLLPSVLKSAVQSSNTVVFVPSSFDFIRVHNYFRKHAGVPFTVLSEYDYPPSDVKSPTHILQVLDKSRHLKSPSSVFQRLKVIPPCQRAFPLLQTVCPTPIPYHHL